MVTLVEEASDGEDDQSGMETDKEEEEATPKKIQKKSTPKKNSSPKTPYDPSKPCWSGCGKLAQWGSVIRFDSY